MSGCELCQADGWQVIVRSDRWRVVRVLDERFPAFYRLIWASHQSEFSDLSPAERAECAELLATIEREMRRALSPTKINLASLGNVVPHLHWHIVARFDWDSHFPQPIWGEAQREVPLARLVTLNEPLAALDQALVKVLQQVAP